MVLLQKRTAELETNLTTLKVSNDEINTELRLALERANLELLEEKERAKLLETEISLREENMKMLEQEITEANENIEDLRENYMTKCIEIEMTRLQPQAKEVVREVQVTKEVPVVREVVREVLKEVPVIK